MFNRLNAKDYIHLDTLFPSALNFVMNSISEIRTSLIFFFKFHAEYLCLFNSGNVS